MPLRGIGAERPANGEGSVWKCPSGVVPNRKHNSFRRICIGWAGTANQPDGNDTVQRQPEPESP
jgi:hypothetical protein